MGAREKFAGELLNELPKLVAENIIDENSAGRLRTHYAAIAAAGQGSARRGLMISLGVLSALLLGGGLSLIFAHNWDVFSPAMRMACGFVPLIAAMCAGGWVLARDKGAVWCEPVAPLIALSFTGTVALVSQVYHSTGTLGELMLLALVASLALMFLFRSTALALMFCIGLCPFFFEYGNSIPYWLKLTVAAGGIAFFLTALNRGRAGWIARLGIVFIVVLIGILSAIKMDSQFSPVIWGVLMFGLWLGGLHDRQSGWRNFLLETGAIGLAVMLSIYSYRSYWVEPRVLWLIFDAGDEKSVIATLFAVLLVLELAYVAFCRRRAEALIPCAVPLLPLLLGWWNQPDWAMIAVNCFMAGCGVWLLAAGFRRRLLSLMNAGMAVLSLQLILRFFTAEKDFLIYGVVFIALGVVFGAGNYVVGRMFRDEKEEAAQ